MAYTINIDKASVGLETVNGEVRFHCLVTVMDGLTPVCKRLVQANRDFADLKGKCEEMLASFAVVPPAVVPVEKTEDEKVEEIKASITEVKITKAVKEIA